MSAQDDLVTVNNLTDQVKQAAHRMHKRTDEIVTMIVNPDQYDVSPRMKDVYRTEYAAFLAEIDRLRALFPPVIGAG